MNNIFFKVLSAPKASDPFLYASIWSTIIFFSSEFFSWAFLIADNVFFILFLISNILQYKSFGSIMYLLNQSVKSKWSRLWLFTETSLMFTAFIAIILGNDEVKMIINPVAILIFIFSLTYRALLNEDGTN